jgi:predicted TIM-barrel fold metal-dependent hydrolase
VTSDATARTTRQDDVFVPSPGCPPPHPSPRRPSLRLPAGSCDSHCHVFGPATIFPYAADRTFTPVDAPVRQLMALHAFLGLDRAVIIQSACYGSNHSALLDALAVGAGRFRGVGLITATTSPTDIAELHAAGVRGFRLNFLPHLGPPPNREEIKTVVALVADLGWHAEVHLRWPDMARYADLIRWFPIPVVIDHLARLDLSKGADTSALLALLDGGDVWIKTSGIDRVSLTGPPFSDAAAFAARLVSHAPERVLWGTDYPHTNINGPAPDDGLLVDRLSGIAPHQDQLYRMLVRNPAEFFGFD